MSLVDFGFPKSTRIYPQELHVLASRQVSGNLTSKYEIPCSTFVIPFYSNLGDYDQPLYM